MMSPPMILFLFFHYAFYDYSDARHADFFYCIPGLRRFTLPLLAVDA